MMGRKRVNYVNPENPFLWIRTQELQCNVDKVAGVSRGTVFALEYGKRKIVTRRVLLVYIQGSCHYTEPESLLHDYQRLYHYPLTSVQDYQGKALNPTGVCEDCGEVRPITTNSAYTTRHICSPCRIKAYNRDPEKRQQRLEYTHRSRGHIGECARCGRSTKYCCVQCQHLVCYSCSHTTGVRDNDGSVLRVCVGCFELFNNS